MQKSRGPSRHKARNSSRRKGHESRIKQPVAPSVHQYDAESGLVYKESTISISKRHGHDWIAEPRSHRPGTRRSANPSPGARTLLEIATRSLAENTRSITAEHLFEVPWSIAEKAWKEIACSNLESFHAWRTFAIAFPEQFASRDKRYLLTIREPSLSLPDYFRGLSCVPTKWLTALRISPRYTGMADLINLASIRNLVVLDLSDDFTIDAPLSFFNERVLSSWTELATNSKGFRHLRVLMLGWQDHAAAWIFKYLKHFPSLCAVILTDCPKMHQRNRIEWDNEARCSGWVARHSKRSAKSLQPIVGNNNFCIGSVSGVYYDTQERFNQLVHDLKPVGMEESLPLVECWIGRPRLWTHMIDEFPGTRTVWFDNVNTTERSFNLPTNAADKMAIDSKGSHQVQSLQSRTSHRQSRNTGSKTLSDLLSDLNASSNPGRIA